MNCEMSIELMDRIQTIVRNQPFGTIVEAVYLKPSAYHRVIEEIKCDTGTHDIDVTINSMKYNIDGHMMYIRVGNIQVHNHPMGVILLGDDEMKEVGKFIDLATNKVHYTTRTSYDRPEDKPADKSTTSEKTFWGELKKQFTLEKLSDFALFVAMVYVIVFLFNFIVNVVTFGKEFSELLNDNKYYLLGAVVLLLISSGLDELSENKS